MNAITLVVMECEYLFREIYRDCVIATTTSKKYREVFHVIKYSKGELPIVTTIGLDDEGTNRDFTPPSDGLSAAKIYVDSACAYITELEIQFSLKRISRVVGSERRIKASSDQRGEATLAEALDDLERNIASFHEIKTANAVFGIMPLLRKLDDTIDYSGMPRFLAIRLLDIMNKVKSIMKSRICDINRLKSKECRLRDYVGLDLGKSISRDNYQN